MYENIKMSEVFEKLDDETVEQLCQNWPELKYVNYIAREFFRRLDIETLSMLYEEGLAINCAYLTVLAAEALIEYDFDYRFNFYKTGIESSVVRSIVVHKLQKAFDHRQIIMGSNLVNVLGFTFLDKCYEHDRLLAKYGHELSRGLIFMGPEEWLKEALKNSKRVPYVARKIPWANALLGA